MDFSGEYRIDADREVVWRALNDPEILQASIPGCEEVTRTAEDEFSARMTAKVGPVRAKFSGKVALSDVDPPNGYTITGEGTGGPAGFARGSASVALSDAPGGGTLLTYQAQGTVGGKLAQIGNRLIDATAKKMASEFFGAFVDQVNLAAAESATATPEAPAPEAAPAPDEAPPPTVSQGLSPALWIGGLIVITVLLLIAFAAWS